jgi:Meiotically up-regulated gene 113
MTRSVVYFVRMGDAVKIGTSTDVIGRMNSLRGGTYQKVELLASIPGGSELERRFHKAFAPARITREFFHATVVLIFVHDIKLGPPGLGIKKIADLARAMDRW